MATNCEVLESCTPAVERCMSSGANLLLQDVVPGMINVMLTRWGGEVRSARSWLAGSRHWANQNSPNMLSNQLLGAFKMVVQIMDSGIYKL